MPNNTVQPGASTDQADAALVRAVATMRPGWVALRGCELAGGEGARARVGYALLHPDVGIALLDVLPGATTPDAPDLLRQSLDAGAFREVFGGYPPIVHLRVPSHSFPSLPSLLEKEFARLRPLALAPRKAWVGSAQRMLTAEPPLCGQAQVAAEERPPSIRPPGPARAEGRRASPPDWRRRALAAFWGAVALALGSGALVLQHLGPPSGGPHARGAAASPGGAYTPRTASHARPGTAPTTQRGTAWSPRPDPVPDTWPSERPPVRPGAEAAPAGAAIREGNTATSAGTTSWRPGPVGAGRARHSGRWARKVVGPSRRRIGASGFRREGLGRHGRYQFQRRGARCHLSFPCSGRRGAVRHVKHHRRWGLAEGGVACRGIRGWADARRLSGRRRSAPRGRGGGADAPPRSRRAGASGRRSPARPTPGGGGARAGDAARDPGAAWSRPRLLVGRDVVGRGAAAAVAGLPAGRARVGRGERRRPERGRVRIPGTGGWCCTTAPAPTPRRRRRAPWPYRCATPASN